MFYGAAYSTVHVGLKVWAPLAVEGTNSYSSVLRKYSVYYSTTCGTEGVTQILTTESTVACIGYRSPAYNGQSV